MSAIAHTLLNNDYAARCVIDSQALPWQQSPSPLVHRRLLERDGGEVARATSIVRYDADARFDHHSHGLGEQILVLEGTLSDELGDYPAGTYLQNPLGSGHAPYSIDGCTLFVKLRYLDPADTERVVINTRTASWFQGMVGGLTVLPLSAFGSRHLFQSSPPPWRRGDPGGRGRVLRRARPLPGWQLAAQPAWQPAPALQCRGLPDSGHHGAPDEHLTGHAVLCPVRPPPAWGAPQGVHHLCSISVFP